jgi:hypothetical protein
MRKYIILFLFLFLCHHSSALARPGAGALIGVDDQDMVKDTDIFNETLMNEKAQILTDNLNVAGPVPKVEVIIDSSGSMDQVLSKNKSKMYFLKELMKPFFLARWKEKNNIGLRIYGGKQKSNCEDTHLLVPFGPNNLVQMEKTVVGLTPGGKTPLHKSLLLSFEDLKKYSGPKRIVVVTDGEDTCGGDPCETVKEINQQKLDLKFFVIALGMKGESDALKKVKCIGDTQVANDDQSFNDALSQISSKISQKENLVVVSPNPGASVYLFEIKPDGKKVLQRVFYASSSQTVPPGSYEAVVGLEPAYKFSKFEIPPNKKVTLKVEGDGIVKVNYFNSLVNVEVLDKNNKPIKRFKSDVATEIPAGRWQLRAFKDPFYEKIFPEFYVYPKGKHEFDLSGIGAVKVESANLQGLYVYNQDSEALGQSITGSTLIIKSGTYLFHVNEECSFQKVQVKDRKEVIVLPCAK